MYLILTCQYLRENQTPSTPPSRRGPQGGAFDKDMDYFRTVLRSKTVIPGLDTALRTMKLGGIRQVIVPYGPCRTPRGTRRTTSWSEADDVQRDARPEFCAGEPPRR